MRSKRWGILALLGGAGLAALAVQGRAEIHNGGVDCTNWNGTYHLVGASANDRSLLPPEKDTITIKQDSCAGVDMTVTVGGQSYTINARTNNSGNRRPMTVNGRTCIVYATWVDGFGKNWTVALTPDPLRPSVPYSVREYLLTSYHTVTVQDSVRDPRNTIPLATFGESGGKKGGGSKIQEVVDSRAVYLMNVESNSR